MVVVVVESYMFPVLHNTDSLRIAGNDSNLVVACPGVDVSLPVPYWVQMSLFASIQIRLAFSLWTFVLSHPRPKIFFALLPRSFGPAFSLVFRVRRSLL
jgi:hypothetical protein